MKLYRVIFTTMFVSCLFFVFAVTSSYAQENYTEKALDIHTIKDALLLTPDDILDPLGAAKSLSGFEEDMEKETYLRREVTIDEIVKRLNKRLLKNDLIDTLYPDYKNEIFSEPISILLEEHNKTKGGLKSDALRLLNHLLICEKLSDSVKPFDGLNQYRDLKAEFIVGVMYPNLELRQFVEVDFSVIEEDYYFSTFSETDYHEKNYIDNDDWIIRKVGKDFEKEKIHAYAQENRLSTDYEFSKTGNKKHRIYLSPGSVKKGDKLLIGFKHYRFYYMNGLPDNARGIVLPATIWHAEDYTENLKSADPKDSQKKYNLKVIPKQVKKQELLEGDPKDVTQIELEYENPVEKSGIFKSNNYIVTKNILSTERLDLTAKFDVAVGHKSMLNKNWLVPACLEARYYGNQAFTNEYIGLSYKFSRRIPLTYKESEMKAREYAFARKYFKSPKLTVDFQFLKWLDKDEKLKATWNKDEIFRLYGELKWDPIFESDDLKMSLLAQGWWFPIKRMNKKSAENAESDDYISEKFEGWLEIAIFIPIKPGTTNVSFGESFQGIELKYTTGGCEANEFKRSDTIKVNYIFKTS